MSLLDFRFFFFRLLLWFSSEISKWKRQNPDPDQATQDYLLFSGKEEVA
jgi:hypothetical protein